MPELCIESLDHEGQGVARLAGKTVFVEGALAGEIVEARITRSKGSYDRAVAEHVIRRSPLRVEPRCKHFGVCGGCSMQHVDPLAQIAVKQRVLEDNLARIGNVRAEQILPPIIGPAWGYRTRARLSVRHVPKKGGVLVGFHERRSSYVTDMQFCHVLPAAIAALLMPLRELVSTLSVRDRVPQIEYAQGDGPAVLVLRHLEPLGETDRQRLRAFGERHGIQWWLQPRGPDSAHPLLDTPLPGYRLHEFGVQHVFSPTEFTQVNPAINEVLVRRAVGLLALRPTDRVGDLFCGLGNFTLPIARTAAFVLGIEGADSLVRRARAGANAHGLGERCRFEAANLFELAEDWFSRLPQLDKLLIDPPRDGAIEVVKRLPRASASRVERIVYVSCNPATLARDAAVLVHDRGYRLRAAGIANMFPHTAHVESMALFTRD